MRHSEWEIYRSSTLLQIAIKEAYVPEVPLIAIDEMMLDFDHDRVQEIMNYLSNVANYSVQAQVDIRTMMLISM